jgi:hypothetical protein
MKGLQGVRRTPGIPSAARGKLHDPVFPITEDLPSPPAREKALHSYHFWEAAA